MWKIFLAWIFIFSLVSFSDACIHDEFALNTTRHFLNDLTDKRLLADT